MKHTKLFFIVAMVMSTTLLHAQIIKSVTLSPDTAYTEQLSLKAGNKDMDIALKLAFDETKNTLTVSINASKMVFVFWANVKYKHIIHNRWLHPDKLPYIVSCHPQDRFRFTKVFGSLLNNDLNDSSVDDLTKILTQMLSDEPEKKEEVKETSETDSLEDVAMSAFMDSLKHIMD